MDALFPTLLAKVLGPGRPRVTDTLPSMTGSAWGHGWYSLVSRDLSAVVAAGGLPKWNGLERLRFIPP